MKWMLTAHRSCQRSITTAKYVYSWETPFAIGHKKMWHWVLIPRCNIGAHFPDIGLTTRRCHLAAVQVWELTSRSRSLGRRCSSESTPDGLRAGYMKQRLLQQLWEYFLCDERAPEGPEGFEAIILHGAGLDILRRRLGNCGCWLFSEWYNLARRIARTLLSVVRHR